MAKKKTGCFQYHADIAACTDPRAEEEAKEREREFKEVDTTVKLSCVETFPSEVDALLNRVTFEGFSGMIKFSCVINQWPFKIGIEPGDRYTVDEITQKLKPYILSHYES